MVVLHDAAGLAATCVSGHGASRDPRTYVWMLCFLMTGYTFITATNMDRPLPWWYGNVHDMQLEGGMYLGW